MNSQTFHINLYDLAFLGIFFIGFTFMVLLWVTQKINLAANRMLALALGIIVLWVARLSGNDIGLSAYFLHWGRLPLQWSLALGPLIFFYVLKITRPTYTFRSKDLLHFIPLLIELYAQLAFLSLNSVLPWLTFVSVSSYLYLAHKTIKQFYKR